MICNSCNKREAAVIVQMSINGQLMSRNLCAACAQQMHIEIAKSLAHAGSLLDMLKNQSVPEHDAGRAPQAPEVICSHCGHAIRELTATARLGCANCYDAFRDRIAAVINPEYKSVPVNAPTVEKRREIRRQLEQALVAENYELAAQLRDRLRDAAKEGELGA